MKVRATRDGYYNHIRRRTGDVFELVPTERIINFFKDHTLREKVRLNPMATWPKETVSPKDQFSESWMEKVDSKTPESVTTSQQAINKAHDEIAAGRTPQSTRAA